MIQYTPHFTHFKQIGWEKVLDLGKGRQVFWDDYLVDNKQTTATLVLNHPVKLEPPFEFNAPWEGNWVSYPLISKFDDTYRMYYITGTAIDASDLQTDTGRSRVCMIESRDGITWTRPSLGIVDWNGSTDNNIVFSTDEHLVDNFFVFQDENPKCPADEKIKATAMIENRQITFAEGRRALWCFTSSDGLHFKKAFKMTDSSVPDGGIFDSTNVTFWDKTTEKYVAFVRGIHDGPGRGTAGGLRDVRYMESEDLKTWTKPQVLDFGDSDDVELYTNNVSRYYRAPNIFLGFPTRYTERHWLVKNFDYLGGKENVEMRKQAAKVFEPREGFVITDGLFMTSHDGLNWHKFDEAIFALCSGESSAKP